MSQPNAIKAELVIRAAVGSDVLAVREEARPRESGRVTR